MNEPLVILRLTLPKKVADKFRKYCHKHNMTASEIVTLWVDIVTKVPTEPESLIDEGREMMKQMGRDMREAIDDITKDMKKAMDDLFGTKKP